MIIYREKQYKMIDCELTQFDETLFVYGKENDNIMVLNETGNDIWRSLFEHSQSQESVDYRTIIKEVKSNYELSTEDERLFEEDFHEMIRKLIHEKFLVEL